MDIRILGPLEVTDGGRDLELGGFRQRALLARLAVAANRVVAVDTLVDELWGSEALPGARQALQAQVSRIRRALRDQRRVIARPPGYVLNVAADELDAARFETLLRRARAAADQDDLDAAARLWADAEGLWRGAVLEEFEDYPFAQAEAARLEELRIAATEARIEAELSLGRHGELVAELEGLVGAHPYRERLWSHLMLALYRCGRQADALGAYQRVRNILGDQLGIPPSPELVRLEEAMLLQKPELAWVVPQSEIDRPDDLTRRLAQSLGSESGAPKRDQAPTERRKPSSNLPTSTTRFIGRTGQIAEVRQLLGKHALLTLTGPGGVGKTRLALEVVAQLAADFGGGTWLVGLAALNDPRLVTQHVLTTLGVRESPKSSQLEALVGALSARKTLLLLDNCEHLLDGCARLVFELLRTCPSLTILATSREPLGVAGEVVWAVPTLSVPHVQERRSFEQVIEHEACQLFVERAAVAAPQLDLEPHAGVIAELCGRLDGIPLAIELAAARTRALSIPDIARRLDEHLRILIGGPRTAPHRHRTLRAAFDWSYDMLAAEEQALFRRLSVFAGGCTLDAAEAVCGSDDFDVLQLLPALVDKSLVMADRTMRPGRYRLLETLRSYASERLSEAGEHDETKSRHQTWAAALAEAAATGLEGTEQDAWLRLVDDEHDNLGSALDWAGDPEVGLRLAASLGRYWEIRGHFSEGRARLEAWISGTDGPADVRAKALNSAAVLAERQRDLGAAQAFYEESLSIRRSIGDRRQIGVSLHGLANLAVAEGDLPRARTLLEDNLAIGRELGDQQVVAASLMNLGVVAHSVVSRAGDDTDVQEAVAEARLRYRDSLACYREMGDRYSAAIVLWNLGELSLLARQPDMGRDCLEHSLAIRRELRDTPGIARSAFYLVRIALEEGRLADARELQLECLTATREFGSPSEVAAELGVLAEITAASGSHDEARHLFDEILTIARELGDHRSLSLTLGQLGDLASTMREFDRARQALTESAQYAEGLADERVRAWTLVRQARLARLEGDPTEAARLCREVMSLASVPNRRQLRGPLVFALETLGGATADVGDFHEATRLFAMADEIRRSERMPGVFRPRNSECQADIGVIAALRKGVAPGAG